MLQKIIRYLLRRTQVGILYEQHRTERLLAFKAALDRADKA